jgi:peptidoglycan/xylan/chitin deacetylase (PgdA/CDA1 family)
VRVSISVDFEPDCPPFLDSTFRGIEEGAPQLLALFAELGVRATYFTTGRVAELYPGAVRALVEGGHELGCHGVTHTAFDTLDESAARWEIESSAARLRAFAEVTSFRAPYLRFPERYLRLLEEAGFDLDASLARYKRSFRAPRVPTSLTRIPATMTSSMLRLPAWLRDPWLATFRDPVVLFVHPWEFVDLTQYDLRWDCRLGTGPAALHSLRQVIRFYQRRGAEFVCMRELRGSRDARAAAA